MSITGMTREADLVLIDLRCGHPRCNEPNAYRMIGHCANCGRTGLAGLFSAGHEVGQGVLSNAKCPSCGNCTCRWDRLATPDEVPAAANSDDEAPPPDEWEPARYSLDGYARGHLIESWREVPGRGLVVIGSDMAETTLKTARDAEMFLAGLASAECAVHDGEAAT